MQKGWGGDKAKQFKNHYCRGSYSHNSHNSELVYSPVGISLDEKDLEYKFRIKEREPELVKKENEKDKLLERLKMERDVEK